MHWLKVSDLQKTSSTAPSMAISYRTILPVYFRIWRHWREKRFKKFSQLVAPKPIRNILDVGGNTRDWYGRANRAICVDILNLGPQVIGDPPPDSPEIKTLVGDGTQLGFPDNSYDLVFSNSVIEHVGNLEQQVAFAKEALRVGRRVWIQTPAFACSIEPHYLGLFVHWIPEKIRWPFIRWTTFIGLSGAAGNEGLRAIMATTRLLTKKEFTAMFPDCEIWVERLLWVFPKSYVAYKP